MQITVNGESRQTENGQPLSGLLAQLQLGQGRVAVELNGEIVPRSRFDDTRLQEGDRLEIVQAIGGG